MAKAKKQKGMSNAQKLGIGVGLTAAAVAAAGTYFLYGSKDATKNRKKVKSWALKAKGDVLSALEKTEQMTEGEFKDLVNTVGVSYAKVEKLSKKELDEFKKEMAGNWQQLMKSGVAKVFSEGLPAKKVPAKKVAKKASTKKATPKKAPAKKAPAKKTTAKKRS